MCIKYKLIHENNKPAIFFFCFHILHVHGIFLISIISQLDVYSFGVLFCEMCTRELPVPENRRDQIRSVANSDYRTLINNCLRRDVTTRLDSDAVLQTFERWSKQMKGLQDVTSA